MRRMTHSKKYKGIICDLDGTLVDSRRDLTASINYVRAAYGLAPHTLETVTSFIGNGAYMLAKRAFAETDVPLDAAFDMYKKHYAEHCTNATEMYAHVHETLTEISAQNIELAVMTNKPVAQAERVLEYLAIRAFFSIVKGGDSYEKMKPHPLPLLSICSAWGKKPHEVIMTGDHHTDIEAAHAAGMKCIFLRSGYGHAGDAKPDIICESFADIVSELL